MINQQTQISSNRSSLIPKQQQNNKVFEKVPAKKRNLSLKNNFKSSSIKLDEILHEDARNLGIYREAQEPENRSPEFAPNQSFSTLERAPVLNHSYGETFKSRQKS